MATRAAGRSCAPRTADCSRSAGSGCSTMSKPAASIMPHQGACGEMIEMLVDEPFFDDVVAAEKRDVGRIEHQQPARLQHARMIGQHARRVRRDARWCGRNGRCRSARSPAPHLRCARWISSVRGRSAQDSATRSSGSTAVRCGVRRGVQKRAREAAAVGADIQQREARRRNRVARQRVQRGLGAEAFAVAHIAPVGAARNRAPARARRGRCAAGSAPARNARRDRPSARGSSLRARRRGSSASRRQRSQDIAHRSMAPARIR